MIALDLIVCLLITAGFAAYRRFGRSDYERVLRYTEHRLKEDGDAGDVPIIAHWHDLAANAHNALVDLTIAVERTVILSGMIAFLAAIIAACDLGHGVVVWLVAIILLLSDMPRLRLRWQADWRFDGLRLGAVSRRLTYAPSPLDRTLRLSPDDANLLALNDPLRELTFDVSPLGLLSQVNGDPVLLNTRVHVAEEHRMQSSRMMFAAVTDSSMLMWEPFALTVSEPGLKPRVTLRPDRCWMIPHGIMRRKDGNNFVIEGVRAHRPFRIRMYVEPEE